MTRAGAVATAQAAAVRFAKPFVVYRIGGWPPDVFSCTAQENPLPPEADIVTVCDLEGAAATLVRESQPGLFEDADLPH